MYRQHYHSIIVVCEISTAVSPIFHILVRIPTRLLHGKHCKSTPASYGRRRSGGWRDTQLIGHLELGQRGFGTRYCQLGREVV